MNELSAVDKIGILGDSVSLAQAGYLDTSAVLTLLESYKHEEDFNIWYSINNTINLILRALDNDNDKATQLKVRALLADLIGPIFAKLTWDQHPGESDQTTRLRNVVISLLLASETSAEGPAGQEAMRRFEAYTKDPTTLSATLRNTVFFAAARRSPEAWEALFRLYRAPGTSQDLRYSALYALGAPKEEAILQRFYDWVLGSGEVRLQDIFYPFASGAVSNGEFTGRYVMENWSKIDRKENNGLFSIVGRIVEYTFEWARVEKLEEIKTFFAGQECSALTRTLEEVYENIEVRGKWRERIAADLPAFFASREKEEEEEEN